MKSTQSLVYQKSTGFSLLEVIVAISILGIAAVALFQLFSISLRATKKSEDYTRALIYSRSIMDEALANQDISEETTSITIDNNMRCVKSIRLQSSDDKINIYKITVTVIWQPKGLFELTGLKTVYASKDD